MEYRAFRNTGVKVSPLGVGCWQFGDPEWGGMTQDEVDRTVRAAIDHGVNLFDNAEVYGDGRSEEMLGQALRGAQRDRCVVLGKLRRGNLRPENVAAALDASLKRMGLDRVDIYLIHFPVDDLPVADTLGAMEKLKRAGKIGAIGISNYTERALEEALRTGLVDALENCYSLIWRYLDRKMLAELRRRNVATIAYSPLAQGILTGKLARDQVFSPDHTRGKNKLYRGEAYQKAMDVVDALKSMGTKYAKSPSQIALNWTMGRPGIASALVGTRRVGYLTEAVGALGWRLEPSDAARLSQLGLEVDKLLDTALPMWETQPVLEHARS